MVLLSRGRLHLPNLVLLHILLSDSGAGNENWVLVSLERWLQNVYGSVGSGP